MSDFDKGGAALSPEGTLLQPPTAHSTSALTWFVTSLPGPSDNVGVLHYADPPMLACANKTSETVFVNGTPFPLEKSQNWEAVLPW